jgi:hypothetical protein
MDGHNGIHQFLHVHIAASECLTTITRSNKSEENIACELFGTFHYDLLPFQ